MESNRPVRLAALAIIAVCTLPVSLHAQETDALEDPDHAPPRLSVSVGPLTAGRTMNFEGDSGSIRHAPTPYAGAMFRAAGRLATFPELEAHLVLDAEIGYALARSTNLEVQGPSNPSTEFTYGGGRLTLYRQLGERVLLGLGAGLQATSFTVSPNPTYTGHRYLAVDLAVRARWNVVEDIFRLKGDLGAYPLFGVDQSDGAYGDATGFGIRLEGEAVWYPAPNLPGLHLSALYRYQRYRAQFPISPIGTRGGISIDNQHIGSVLLGYEL
jgi:hypothetical protein